MRTPVLMPAICGLCGAQGLRSAAQVADEFLKPNPKPSLGRKLVGPGALNGIVVS